MTRFDLAIVDIDGTLVDSNYPHVLAWSRAFEAVGVRVPMARIHACLGMGGDQLVAAVSSDAVEHGMGDEIRDLWKAAYDELLPQVQPLAGAAELLSGLQGQGTHVVLATSGHPEHTEAALEMLELHRGSYPLVTSEDAERTKPHPDLIEAALRATEHERAVAIGDTVWDVQAAAAVDIPTIGMATGGIADEVLRAAGALTVAEDPVDLYERWSDLV